MNITIIGASHGIGRELVYQYHALGHFLNLCARDKNALEAIKSDLKTNVEIFELDVLDEEKTINLLEKLNDIDLFIYCAGTYKPMASYAINLDEAKKIAQVNFNAVIPCLDVVIPKMIAKESGHIALVASVAGYFGMPQSFTYGASKAALINLAQTLYAELGQFNINVSVINPGFVKTRLTDLNEFKMPAIILAEDAAKEIIKGLNKKKFEIHFPKKFTLWLKFFKILPYKILLSFTSKIAKKNSKHN